MNEPIREWVTEANLLGKDGEDALEAYKKQLEKDRVSLSPVEFREKYSGKVNEEESE